MLRFRESDTIIHVMLNTINGVVHTDILSKKVAFKYKLELLTGRRLIESGIPLPNTSAIYVISVTLVIASLTVF